MTKQSFLAHFEALNRLNITLEEATQVALRAEQERDFRPVLRGGVTVGLSSGTSGTRHVFLVGREDRCRWAGQIFARMLSTACLWQVLLPWHPPLQIAFFLRASSNLYTTLRSHRVKFAYYDLTLPFAELLVALAIQKPQILVAPATVLAELARHAATLNLTSLRQLISVAEVLDSRDKQFIETAFGLPVGQIYQAAEGFLGATCAHGRLHLNEEDLHVEKHWVEDSRQRFQPVITDFSRSTQWFVRHRLTDILRVDPTPCPCGRRTTTLLSIEGRQEEILWSQDLTGKVQPVFPDVLRQALYAMSQPPEQYRIEQHVEVWQVQLHPCTPDLQQAVTAALLALHQRLKLTPPKLEFQPWTEQPASEKRKRLRCITPPK